MENDTSKNLIILLLVGMVIGLVVVLYVVANDRPLVDVESASEVAEEEGEDTTEGEASSANESSEGSAPVVTPPSASVPQTTQTAPQVTEQVPVPPIGDKNMVIVTYTDSGFIPPVVEVRAGGSVTFINSSSKPMWVTSENHPTAKGQIYRGFDQGKSVGKGDTYTFAFTQIGVWGYKNLNLEKHLGAISVIAQ